MKGKKKRKIMPCIEGVTDKKFSRNLYFDPGYLGVTGITLSVSYEKSKAGMSARLSVVTDDNLPDSKEAMDSLFRCMAVANKEDGIEWDFSENGRDYEICITASGFDVIHGILVLAVEKSGSLSANCAEPLLHKMADVIGAFAVEYNRFAGWREGLWK